ncbi:transposase [Streptomyces sp. KMM 9044]|nr:transposase [Streptomyces sp. KMM 9044]WAX79072.1 transposase [Streptomyces sp. KMM 9044]
MGHDTGATALFDLEGVAVAEVVRDEDGIRTVRLVTTAPAARACPACGTFATRVKERAVTRPRDLAHGGGAVRIRWHKRRWQCREDACERGSFTEQIPQIPARMRLTERLRTACGQAVADGGRTVVQTGRDLGPSWPVVMRATRTYAERHLPAALPTTEAIGIDETRRGKPVWKQNPDTEKWELVADAWHIGFVDAIGGRGLFGQVEGRNADSVADWLSAQPAAWREHVRYVAIDLCATFRAAIHRALPHATVVIDCFHIVQLAQRHLADLRRRLTWKQHGRRARKETASTPSANSCAATRKTSPENNSPCSRSSWSTWAPTAVRSTRPGRPRNSCVTSSAWPSTAPTSPPTAPRSPQPATASTPTSPTTPTCPNSSPSPKPSISGGTASRHTS